MRQNTTDHAAYADQLVLVDPTPNACHRPTSIADKSGYRLPAWGLPFDRATYPLAETLSAATIALLPTGLRTAHAIQMHTGSGGAEGWVQDGWIAWESGRIAAEVVGFTADLGWPSGWSSAKVTASDSSVTLSDVPVRITSPARLLASPAGKPLPLDTWGGLVSDATARRLVNLLPTRINGARACGGTPLPKGTLIEFSVDPAQAKTPCDPRGRTLEGVTLYPGAVEMAWSSIPSDGRWAAGCYTGCSQAR